MCPTTIRNRLAAAVAGLALLPVAGCSDGYEQRRLAGDAPQRRELRVMVDALRSGGEEALEGFLAEHGASGLTDVQRAALRASLTEIVRAESVELTELDRFGRDVYRATLRMTTAGQTKPAYFLLIRSGGRLRWAGRN